MLFAKINPVAQIVNQDSPFEFSVTNAEYMTAIAQPYVLGGTSTSFRVVFGKFNEIPPPEDPALPPFVTMYTIQLELTEEQLADWGENDDVVLITIASVIGTTCTEFINRPDITNV